MHTPRSCPGDTVAGSIEHDPVRLLPLDYACNRNYGLMSVEIAMTNHLLCPT
jgi:hypothetical protein